MGRYRGRHVQPPPRWRRPLLLFLTAVLLASGGLWARDLYRAHRERAAYAALAARVHAAQQPSSPTTATPPETPPAAQIAEPEPTPVEPVVTETPTEEAAPSPYEALAQENPDFAGWLWIADTPIDYPVMWTPEEPEYYLRRAFDKSYAVSGSLFLGAGCEPDGAHLMIFGHNLRDGSMFSSLPDYAEADYAAAHPTIRFDTLTQSGEYRVLAAFYSHAYTSDEAGFRYYQYADLSRQADFDEYVRQARVASLYDTGVQAAFGDRLLTLSTCSYHRDNGTFVVVAVASAP